MIYPNDHRPAHIHVIAAGGEAAFMLNCPDGPPELRAQYGMALQAANRIQKALAGHVSALCLKWREFHGDF